MPDTSPSPLEYQIFDPETQEIRVVVVRPPRHRYWLHALLFLATVFTTLCIGARLQYNFNMSRPAFTMDADYFPWAWALSDYRHLLLGLPFSLSLLGILTAHELGHYILCVRRKVFATLPFFIPAPTLIGTFGAFIRIKSPIRTRKDLFDIGVAGPIAGFVVAVPILFFALLASKPLTASDNQWGVLFGFPLIYHAAQWVLTALGSHAPAATLQLGQIYPHPTAIAAWVGMFATSLNLLPGGQLDGGHILFSVNPRLHRKATYLAIAALLPLSWFYWAGWLLWAVVLRITSQHPAVPPWPELDGKRKVLAVFALLILLLTFAYDPLPGGSLRELLHH
jgi:membrane-associated protease RseP (regulator of RpoE activity)